MKGTKGHNKVHIDGMLDKSVRFEMSSALWDKLSAVADVEGREQGRPKSVSAVMRKMLQAGVEAKAK